MASITPRKLCAKCNKGGRVAICDGCQQSLCTKHFIEHRQELSHQMDTIGREHDLLQRDLSQESDAHPLLSRIDKWERESITKIQAAAETARADLQHWLHQENNKLITSIGKVNEELQSSREAYDYTEIELKKWIEQLESLRKNLETPLAIEIGYEDSEQSCIRLIKLKDKQQPILSTRTSRLSKRKVHALLQAIQLVRERFDEVAGRVTLFEEGRVATCSGIVFPGSIICGVNRYLKKTHHIRLFIEQKGKYDLFFGIMPSIEKIDQMKLPQHANGWWDVDYCITNGRSEKKRDHKTIQTGDEVTLTLDCANRQIHLQHHRTNRRVYLPIDLRLCPFPWKLLVELFSPGDCVRILD